MLKIVSLESYYSKETQRFINKLPKDALYIAATQGIKSLRHAAISFDTLIKQIKGNVKQSGDYITTHDQVFILGNTIKERFGETARGQAFYRERRRIFELFEILLDKPEAFDIPAKIERIKRKSNESTADLFNLYHAFVWNLTAARGKYKLQQEAITAGIADTVAGKRALIMEGFLYLTREQRQFITAAAAQNKEVYLITKKNQFTADTLYKPLVAELGAQTEYIEIAGREPARQQNSITIIADNLFVNRTFSAGAALDKSVLFIEPFVSREEEFKFIIRDILRYLAETCGNDKDKIKATLERDIAVRLHSKKDKVHFNELLKQLAPGFRLNISERSLLDFTLGQFIYNLYKIISAGLDIETYKKLLFTQWKYNRTADVTKYDNALSAFALLEPFFKNIDNVESWLITIERLKATKTEIIGKHYCYLYHPLTVVGIESLDFLHSHLTFIKTLVDELGAIEGTNGEHIEVLKRRLAAAADADTKAEIVALLSVIQKLNDNSKLKISASYFAETIRTMLTEYELETETSSDDLFIRLINIENFCKFRRVYIPKFESGIYPHNIDKLFPFTQPVLDILRDEFAYSLYPWIENDFHFFIKNYFDFTDETLVFTQTEIEDGTPTLPSVYVEDIFTLYNSDIKYVKHEQSGEPVTAAQAPEYIRLDLKKGGHIPLPNLILYLACPKALYHLQGGNMCYEGEIQLGLYAGAVLYVRFFENLAAKYGTSIFGLNDMLKIETECLLKETLAEINRAFDYMSQVELDDVYYKTLESIYFFYNKELRNGKFAARRFSFRVSQPKIINVDGWNIRIDSKLIIYNADKKADKEFDLCSGLYYLVKSGGGRKYKLDHWAQIIEQLDKGADGDDRLKLAAHAFFKVDVQLAESKYYNDGISRIKTIVGSFNNCEFKSTPSEGCNFCKAVGICKRQSWGGRL